MCVCLLVVEMVCVSMCVCVSPSLACVSGFVYKVVGCVWEVYFVRLCVCGRCFLCVCMCVGGVFVSFLDWHMLQCVCVVVVVCVCVNV